jgi:hypothetical protein
VAGQLGVGFMHTMLERGHLRGGDGSFDPEHARDDRPASCGRDIDYQLTGSGRALLD